MSNQSTQQAEQILSKVPCFFFSYARNDVDKYLQRFFEDLSEAVARKGALERETGAVSFRDIQDIEPGQDWENEIAQALQHSQVLVCVYTTWYFQREYCGKEVHIFLQRKRGVRFEGGCFRDSAGIVPIFWLDKRDLTRRRVPPLSLSRIQVYDPDPDERNEKEKRGLRQILVNGGRRGQYWTFVEDLAGTILDISAEHPLPSLDARPTLGGVKSIFHDLSDWTQRDANDSSGAPESQIDKAALPVRPMPGKGLRVFLLQYAAAGGDEPFTFTSHGSCALSPLPVGVLPLPSGTHDTVGSMLDAVASQLGFGCQELLVDTTHDSVVDDISEVLREAVARNTVIVLVLGDQAMPPGEGAVRLQCAIQEHNAFVVAMSLVDRNQIPSDARPGFETPTDRLLVAELDVGDHESVISRVFESLLIEVTTRILANGNVKRAVESTGPLENPRIGGPGSGGRYER